MDPQTERILAALGYIEQHLCEPIMVSDIARAAGYSLFHFIRTFNKIVRHTPYDYLMRRRLSHAALLLLDTDMRVLDIALACQFETHEGFTRAFGRLFGMTPVKWRENRNPDRRFIMPPLTEEDLLFRQTLENCPPKRIYLNQKTLVGWMKVLENGSEDPQDFSRSFKMIWDQQAEPDNADALWEMQTHPVLQDQPKLYFIGKQVGWTEAYYGQFIIWRIEAGDYLCFSEPSLSADWTAARNYLYHTFLPKSGLQLGAVLEVRRLGEPSAVYLPIQRSTQSSRSD
jgi:AraC family transcriptional regulator